MPTWGSSWLRRLDESLPVASLQCNSNCWTKVIAQPALSLGATITCCRHHDFGPSFSATVLLRQRSQAHSVANLEQPNVRRHAPCVYPWSLSACSTLHYAPQPNCGFNADANIGHAFGIFMAYVGAALRARRRLTRALGSPSNHHIRLAKAQLRTALWMLCHPNPSIDAKVHSRCRPNSGGSMGMRFGGHVRGSCPDVEANGFHGQTRSTKCTPKSHGRLPERFFNKRLS